MKLVLKIRLIIIFFMIVLVLSGITAFPVETELRWLLANKNLIPDTFEPWLQKVFAIM